MPPKSPKSGDESQALVEFGDMELPLSPPSSPLSDAMSDEGQGQGQEQEEQEEQLSGTPPRNVAPVLVGPVTLGDVELPLYAFNPSLHTKNRIADRKMDAQYQIACDGVDFYTFAELQQFHEKRSSVSVDHTNPRDVITLGEVSDRFDVTLYRFVILADGRMICGRNDPYEEFSHQNMVSRYNVRRSKGLTFRERCLGSLSDNVLVAGEIGLDSLGRIQYVSNRTGHYRVPPGVLRDVVYPCLEAHGITVENINLMYKQEYTQDQPEHDIGRVSLIENYSANTPGLVEALRSVQKPSINLQGEKSKRKSCGGGFSGPFEIQGSSSSVQGSLPPPDLTQVQVAPKFKRPPQSAQSQDEKNDIDLYDGEMLNNGLRVDGNLGGDFSPSQSSREFLNSLREAESADDMPMQSSSSFNAGVRNNSHRRVEGGLIEALESAQRSPEILGSSSSAPGSLSSLGLPQKKGGSRKKSRAGGNLGDALEDNQSVFALSQYESSPNKEDMQPCQRGLFGRHEQNENGLIEALKSAQRSPEILGSSSSALGSLSSLGLHQKKKGSRKKSRAGDNLSDALGAHQSPIDLLQYESSQNKENMQNMQNMPSCQRGLFGRHEQNKNGIDSSQQNKRGRVENDGPFDGESLNKSRRVDGNLGGDFSL